MIYGDKVSNVEGNAGESEDESSKFRESLDQRSSRQRGLSLNSGSIATTLHDTEDRRSALYDGYGNGISGVKNKDPLGKITPAAHNVVSARSPYAAFIRLMRRCWAESPSYRHSARELYEEIHTIWRSICHRLVMYVQYDPNTNSNYSAAGRSSPTLDSRVSQATGCSGISAYHNPYERATSALIRNQSSIGSTFSALVRSVSQADKDRPFPPLVRQSSSVGNFSPISRTNSQAEPKTWISIGNSSPIAAENIHSKPSATESASSDKVSSENFQSVLACVAADPSYAALDADGGAWVIVSNDSPHFILRSTFAFCDMFGINCACEGQSLVDALDCPKGVDVELLNKFLYEMTLFNIHESVMRRKETAKCTTALYPSYFCNHALLSLFGADFTDRALHPKHSTDSDRNPHKFDAHTTEKTLRSKSTSTLSSNTYNSMHGDAENGTKRNSKGVFLYKFSVHAFPLFAASPVNPGTAETVEEEDDLSDAASITSARSSKTGLDDTNARMAITADMSPVVYALYFSKFKKIVERSRASSESYTSALSGMVRGLGSMMPAFTGNGITSSQTATTKSRPPKAVQRI